MADPPNLDLLASRLLEAARKGGWRIATAESCTGGLIASLLTDVEGLGHLFECGFVAYSDSAKSTMLGIDQRLIDTHGAVSAEVAEAMVRGANAHSNAEVTLAVTGFAGPAGPEDEEGLVYIAISCRDRVKVEECHWGAIGRDAIREKSARAALRLALRLIMAEEE